MALPKPPPSVEIPPDTKRAIFAGVRKIVDIFQGEGKISPGITHADVLHDPICWPNSSGSFAPIPRSTPTSWSASTGGRCR